MTTAGSREDRIPSSNPSEDLEQLWRRIVFFIMVSNTDDHLRNHGLMLQPTGWSLSPAYDMNPNSDGEGLKLNISESDNAQDLELVLSVASVFRVAAPRAGEIVDEVRRAVGQWAEIASSLGIARSEQEHMRRAFRIAGQ